MKYLLVIVLTSFVAVTVFGVFGMNHTNGHNEARGCIAATSQGIDCPKEAGITFAAFHLDAFKHFSTAIFGLLLISLFAAIGLSLGRTSLAPPCAARISRAYRECLRLLSTRSYTRWLALHENSPAFL